MLFHGYLLGTLYILFTDKNICCGEKNFQIDDGSNKEIKKINSIISLHGENGRNLNGKIISMMKQLPVVNKISEVDTTSHDNQINEARVVAQDLKKEYVVETTESILELLQKVDNECM